MSRRHFRRPRFPSNKLRHERGCFRKNLNKKSKKCNRRTKKGPDAVPTTHRYLILTHKGRTGHSQHPFGGILQRERMANVHNTGNLRRLCLFVKSHGVKSSSRHAKPLPDTTDLPCVHFERLRAQSIIICERFLHGTAADPAFQAQSRHPKSAKQPATGPASTRFILYHHDLRKSSEIFRNCQNIYQTASNR